MKRNVANLDRLIRGLLGVSILITGLYLQSWLALLGAALVVSALVCWCPLYTLLHTGTYHEPRHGAHTLRHAGAGSMAARASAPLADQGKGAWVKAWGQPRRGTPTAAKSVPKPYARRSTQHDE